MSKEVKRYDPFGYDGMSALMHEDVLGDYVRHEDYEVLLEENQRLRQLTSEKVMNSTMLREFVARDGGLNIGLEGGACALMAQAFGKQLYDSEALNYVEASFESPDYPDLGQITVTVKRESGKTPHQLRKEAEAERDALLAERDALKADLERAHRATNSECMDWAREYERRREVQAERDQIRAEVERLREAELLLLSVCDDLMRHENADVRMVTCIELNNWLTRRAALQGAKP